MKSQSMAFRLPWGMGNQTTEQQALRNTMKDAYIRLHKTRSVKGRILLAAWLSALSHVDEDKE